MSDSGLEATHASLARDPSVPPMNLDTGSGQCPAIHYQLSNLA